MKTLEKCYLVISVAEITAMLRAAELEQKRRNSFKGFECLVLTDIAVEDVGEKEPQIASWSVSRAVAQSTQASQKSIDDATRREEETVMLEKSADVI